MPQLSLYIDKETLKKLELAAKIERLSISKYVVRKLNESLKNSWPGKYDDLYGSISDDTFQRPDNMVFTADSDRERL
jgi:hypothetical protein